MKNLVLLIFLLLGFAACSNKTDGKQTAEQKDSIETFDSFFVKFKTDSVFQKERVVFPFVNETSGYDSDADEEFCDVEKIEAKDWKFLPFDWDASYATRQIEAYDQKIETVNDTTNIFYLGMDNGINVQAIFVLKDGKWFYAKMVDKSM